MMDWGRLIAIIVVLRRVPGRLNRPATSLPPNAGAIRTPSQNLDVRCAKGDLTAEEYLERVEHLGSA